MVRAAARSDGVLPTPYFSRWVWGFDRCRFCGGGVAGALERHRPAEPAGGAGEAQAQEEAPRAVPQLFLHGTIPSPS